MVMARPLKMFMRGENVRMLQKSLCSMGFQIDDKIGMFGTSTRDAVKALQRQHGLKQNGQVDDALLQMIQPCKAASKDEQVEDKSVSKLDSDLRNAFDALVRLMVRKGLFDEQELNDEISRSQAIRERQAPLL